MGVLQFHNACLHPHINFVPEFHGAALDVLLSSSIKLYLYFYSNRRIYSYLKLVLYVQFDRQGAVLEIYVKELLIQRQYSTCSVFWAEAFLFAGGFGERLAPDIKRREVG